MIPPRLEHCPVCSYSLESLPDKPRCPECGFEYGKRTLVIKQASRGLAISFLAASAWLFLIAISIVAEFTKGGQFSVNWSELPCACLLLLAIPSGLAAGWRWLSGERNMAILSIRGVAIVEPGALPRHLSWRDIKEVKASWVSGAPQLVNELGYDCGSMSSEFFGSTRRTRKFIKAAQEWKARHDAAVAAHRTPE